MFFFVSRIRYVVECRFLREKAVKCIAYECVVFFLFGNRENKVLEYDEVQGQSIRCSIVNVVVCL